MRPILPIVAASICIAQPAAVLGQRAAPTSGQPTAADAESTETIIVRGERGSVWGKLRIEIERAEEAVFSRFNEINSTDDFDIHCRPESYGRFRFRSCRSNSWNEETGKIGAEQARGMQGRGSPGAVLLIARERARKQQLLNAEMRDLVGEDEQLRRAVTNLSEARLALVREQGNVTLVREVSPVNGNLPSDTARVFEVIMGNDPYRLRLMQRTFAVANVVGTIRKIGVDCAEGKQRLEYVEDVDWTLPSGWSACIVRVDAKKGTTFNLYEF